MVKNHSSHEDFLFPLTRFRFRPEGYCSLSQQTPSQMCALKTIITRDCHTILFISAKWVTNLGFYDTRLTDKTWNENNQLLFWPTKSTNHRGEHAVDGKPLVDSGSNRSCSFVIFTEWCIFLIKTSRLSKLGWKIPLQHISPRHPL